MSNKTIISFPVNIYGTRVQETIHNFLISQDTCYLQIRPSKRNDKNSRPGLFCCGEHFGFIGYPSEESKIAAYAALWKKPIKVEGVTRHTAYGLLDDSNYGIVEKIDVSCGGDDNAET